MYAYLLSPAPHPRSQTFGQVNAVDDIETDAVAQEGIEGQEGWLDIWRAIRGAG